MSTYPSIVTSLTNPQPTDRLNSPSHSSIETSQNDAISKIETFVGTLSSTAGTLIYDIRSSNSNGGGHVQTAVKGGTGQTTFNKGDLLVAQSASVLGKLAVGTDTQLLSVDSSTASGVKWVTPTSPKLFTSVITNNLGTNTTGEFSIFSYTLPGSTLGINNAVKATLYINNWVMATTSSILVQYGGNTVGSIMQVNGISGNVGGRFEVILVSKGTVSVQSGYVQGFAQSYAPQLGSSIISAITKGRTSVNSDANQVFGMTYRAGNTDGANIFTPGEVVIERIS